MTAIQSVILTNPEPRCSQNNAVIQYKIDKAMMAI